MNAAEEIVKFWYKQQGYFTRESTPVPHSRNREIDLLAVKILGEKVVDRVHIEVQVSNNSVNSHTALQLADDYDSKFSHPTITEFIKPFFGKKYRKVEVRGNIRKGNRDIRDEYIRIRNKKYKVEVIPFERILSEVVSGLGAGTQSNSVIQAIQLTKFQNKPTNKKKVAEF